ncbi:hypothetical protein KFK09_000364 [Dendrobium nobile]|uniref:EF-hand domain-containing protein n=1 Tax=Dendrobium nobile TaxID=94219 RepID=A0A8T3CAX4_DENNO|nr:hypothetical protein KFK09_000364 [Dendrobium nobile]
MTAKPFLVQNLHASYSMPQVMLNNYYKRVYSFLRYHLFSWRHSGERKRCERDGYPLAEAGCTLRVSGDTPSSLPADPHKFGRHIDRLSSAETLYCLSLLLLLLLLHPKPSKLPQVPIPLLLRVLIPVSHDRGFSRGESLARSLDWRSKSEVTKLLKANGFADFIDATISPPPRLQQTSNGQTITNPSYTEWVLIDQNLAAALCSTITLAILPFVLNLDSSAEIWTTIERRLQSSNRSRVIQLKNELHNIFMKQNSMAEYLNEVKTLVDKIAAVGAMIDKEYIILYTLNGLSPTYQSFKSTIRTMVQPLSFDDLYAFLISEEININTEATRQQKTADQNIAMYSIRGRGSSLFTFSSFSLKKMLLEDSNVIAPVLDSFTALNLDEQLQDYFPSFVSLYEYLPTCKEKQARNFVIHQYKLLFVEFKDTYSRQEISVFLWFALFGWWFRFFILATWVLPSAALLIRIFAYSFAIKAKDCSKRIKMFIYLLKRMFSNLDTEKSGSITYEELKTGLAWLGSKLSKK